VKLLVGVAGLTWVKGVEGVSVMGKLLESNDVLNFVVDASSDSVLKKKYSKTRFSAF